MILSTTDTIQGREVERHLGIVFGDAVLGVNVLKDLMGSVRDFIGGRSGTYERELGAARDAAMTALVAQAESLGADAVLGIDLDYEVLGGNGQMLMVCASGTAVTLRPLLAASPGAQPGGS